MRSPGAAGAELPDAAPLSEGMGLLLPVVASVYGCAGGGAGIRTPDLYSAIVALSQLSYTPAWLDYTTHRSGMSIE